MHGKLLIVEKNRPAANPQGPSWRIEGGRLLNFREGVGWIQPSASEVWSAVFGGSGYTHAEPSPADVLPGFGFSRFPVELAIEVSGCAPENIHALVEAAKKYGVYQ